VLLSFANAQNNTQPTVVVTDNSGTQTYCAADNQHLNIEGTGFQSNQIFDYTLTITGEGCSALHATTLVSRMSDTLLTVVDDLTGCTGDIFATLKYQNQDALQPVKIATRNDNCVAIRDTSHILTYCPGPTRLVYVECTGVRFTEVFDFTFVLTGDGCGSNRNRSSDSSESGNSGSGSDAENTTTIIEVTPVSNNTCFIVTDLSGCTGDIWAQITYQSQTSEKRRIATLNENCVSIVAVNESTKATTTCPDTTRTYCPGTPRLIHIEGTGFESTEPFDYTLTLTGEGCTNLHATTLVSRVSDTELTCIDDLTGCTGDIWAVLNYKKQGFLQPVKVATIGDNCVGVRDTSKVLSYCPGPLRILYVECEGLEFTTFHEYNVSVSGEGCSALHGARVTPVSDTLLCVVGDLSDCTGDIYCSLNYTKHILPPNNTPAQNNTVPENNTVPDGQLPPPPATSSEQTVTVVEERRVVVLAPIKIAVLSPSCVFISMLPPRPTVLTPNCSSLKARVSVRLRRLITHCPSLEQAVPPYMPRHW